jgi:hypothetical protein
MGSGYSVTNFLVIAMYINNLPADNGRLSLVSNFASMNCDIESTTYAGKW